jgi:hypothetical protein
MLSVRWMEEGGTRLPFLCSDVIPPELVGAYGWTPTHKFLCPLVVRIRSPPYAAPFSEVEQVQSQPASNTKTFERRVQHWASPRPLDTHHIHLHLCRAHSDDARISGRELGARGLVAARSVEEYRGTSGIRSSCCANRTRATRRECGLCGLATVVPGFFELGVRVDERGGKRGLAETA